MQNNPNQEIHTDYRADDVFKPINANQLARAVHYDFVITQEMFDNYIEKNPGETDVDIGVLLCSDYAGTVQPVTTLAKAPVSIYIAANTSGYTLDFTGALIASVIDCSDFKPNGNWSSTLTKDMVSVYSSYSYKISHLAGGFNLWTTPTAYVYTDGSNAWAGICKIGTYNLTTATNIIRPDDFQLVIQGVNLGTESFTYNFSDTAPYEYANTARPSIVYADWMNGGGVTSDYIVYGRDTTTPTTLKNGLYAQLHESLTVYNTKPVLIVAHNRVSAYYALCEWGETYFKFSSVDGGTTVTVYKTGYVEWEDIQASSNGSSGKVVLADFAINGIPLVFINGTANKYASSVTYSSPSGGSWDWSKVTVSRNGLPFKTIKEDCPESRSTYLTWYNSVNTEAFKFKGATQLDYYRWGAIFAPINTDIKWTTEFSDNLCKWWTAHKELYIDADDLVEGVVYTICVHVMQLAMGTETPAHGSLSHQLFEQDLSLSYSDTLVYFVKNNTYIDPLYWGNDSMDTAGNNHSNVICNYTKQTPAYSMSTTPKGLELAEIGRAELVFVKLNGNVYVMKY
jgi:hypothetical protein